MLDERIGSAELRELATEQAVRELRIDPASLPRLAEQIVAPPPVSEPLKVVLEFAMGPEGFPVLTVRATGELVLQCQRCLGPLRRNLALDCELTVVSAEEELVRIADPFDSVVTGPDGLELSAAIEDELLAVLPMVPRHDRDCSAGEHELAKPVEPTERPNRPFEGLAAIMSKRSADHAD